MRRWWNLAFVILLVASPAFGLTYSDGAGIRPLVCPEGPSIGPLIWPEGASFGPLIWPEGPSIGPLIWPTRVVGCHHPAVGDRDTAGTHTGNR